MDRQEASYQPVDVAQIMVSNSNTLVHDLYLQYATFYRCQWRLQLMKEAQLGFGKHLFTKMNKLKSVRFRELVT